MKATSLNRSPSKPRPALRLISTKELPREDWLQIRKQGIGSSDAGAAVGLNPYKSQLELWMEKTGRDTTLPKADPHDEESPMYWGNVLEPIVAWAMPAERSFPAAMSAGAKPRTASASMSLNCSRTSPTCRPNTHC